MLYCAVASVESNGEGWCIKLQVAHKIWLVVDSSGHVSLWERDDDVERLRVSAEVRSSGLHEHE